MNEDHQDYTSEIIVDSTDTLHLPLEDSKIVSLLDEKLTDAKSFFENKLNLKERRNKLRDGWLGNQLKDEKLYKHEQRYVDNLIYQDLETRVAIAASRLSDIIVTPPNDDKKSADLAQAVSKALKIRISTDQTKQLMKDGTRHHELFFIGCIKPYWDPTIGEHGDYSFCLVHPEKMVLDASATIPHDGFTPDNMDIVGEWIEEPVDVVYGKFPKKKDELQRMLGAKRPSKIRYLEAHFTYYDTKTDDKGEVQPVVYEAVAWKFGSLILDKKLDPYYDWKGYEKAGDKPQLGEDGAPVPGLGGDPLMQVETVYRNHFDRPHKPYIFFTYQNLGESPIDDTTAVEQALPLQQAVNKRGRQITELADRAAGKLAFSSAMSAEEIRKITNDPRQHIRLSDAVDDVRQAVVLLPGTPPPPVLFQDLFSMRGQIDAKFSTHAQTRGETVNGESGLAKQVTREGDLAISDDIATTMIQRVLGEMANWAVQMMKLFYTEPHYVRDIGTDGKLVYAELTQDMVEDGIAVMVKASSTDKSKRHENAIEMANRKLIDPYNFFIDMDLDKPNERTTALLNFLVGQADGYAQYAQALGLDFQPPQPPAMGPDGQPLPPGAVPPPQGGQVPPPPGSQPGQPQEMGVDQAQTDLQSLEQGQDITPSGIPSEQYIEFFMQFVKSPAFSSFPPEIQQLVQQYVQKLKSVVS